MVESGVWITLCWVGSWLWGVGEQAIWKLETKQIPGIGWARHAAALKVTDTRGFDRYWILECLILIKDSWWFDDYGLIGGMVLAVSFWAFMFFKVGSRLNRLLCCLRECIKRSTTWKQSNRWISVESRRNVHWTLNFDQWRFSDFGTQRSIIIQPNRRIPVKAKLPEQLIVFNGFAKKRSKWGLHCFHLGYQSAWLEVNDKIKNEQNLFCIRESMTYHFADNQKKVTVNRISDTFRRKDNFEVQNDNYCVKFLGRKR